LRSDERERERERESERTTRREDETLQHRNDKSIHSQLASGEEGGERGLLEGPESSQLVKLVLSAMFLCQERERERVLFIKKITPRAPTWGFWPSGLSYQTRRKMSSKS
jgi:hypothetical protein